VALFSKIKRVIYGAEDEKNGYKKIVQGNWPFHPKTELVYGILKDDCLKLMKDFFKNKR
jgi:tRNA(adenine34) deaminase